MTTHIILSRTQKYCLIFTLTLALTLIWTTLARADGPGDLDITFGGTGIVTDSISSGNDGGLSVAIQPDGKIVVAGISDEVGANDSFAVIRYNSDGSRDTDFNSTGIVTTPVGTFGNSGFSVAIQPDDKIVIAGRSINPAWGGSKFTVLRYNITGTLDTDFNNGTGIITTSIGSSFDEGRAMALQPDGKIVVTGDTENPSALGSDIAVVRYTSTGTQDATFNGTGIVTTPITSVFDRGRGVAIQPDGKIVVAGSSGTSLVVVRYTITGTLDTDFNGTGIVTTPNAVGNSVALQPDGKIVVAGSSGGDFAVVRYNSDGSPDTTFNGTGIATTFITSELDEGRSVAIQPNGKIVVAGSSGITLADEDDIAVVRYNNDGSLDTTFGNTGVVTTSITNNLDAAWGVAIQPDGKIVAAGFSNGGVGGEATFAVVRYLGDHFTYLPVVLKN